MMRTYHSSFDRNKQSIDKNAMDKFDKLKVKCKYCGHSMIMKVQQDYKICDFCKHKVNNNTRDYFTYKLRKELNKIEK